MQSLIDQFADWFSSQMVSAIMSNISGLFDAVNDEVSQVATQVGTTPTNFSPRVFNLIRNLSTSVIMPTPKNKKNYILTSLYNSVLTKESHLQMLFNSKYGESVRKEANA